MNRKAAARLLPFVLLASGASAQSQWVLGKGNAEFARRLFEEGYPELSRSLSKTIETTGAETDKLDITALGFELDLDEAKHENDFARRRAKLGAIITAENAFIKDNARTTVADIVRAHLPTVYLDLATTITAGLTKESDPAKRAELTQEGQGVFIEAKHSLSERIDRLKQQQQAGTGNVQRVEQQLYNASFNLAKMEYLQSSIYPDNSPERNDAVNAALEAFHDFGFEYSHTPLSYQGIIWQGLCHESQGKLEDALADYQDAIAMPDEENVEKNSKGQYQLDSSDADMVSGATLHLVKLLTRMKRYMEAVAAATNYLNTIPDPLLTSSGVEVVAAKAEAEKASGDIASASATAQSLVDFDNQGQAGRLGRDILGGLPVSTLAPDKILRIAEQTAQRGDFARALDLCRRARENARGTKDEQDSGCQAFLQIGEIYKRQQRWYEASSAYDCASELYPKARQRPEALYSAVNVYLTLSKSEKARYFGKRADERMKSLAKDYPQHPLAAQAGIFQGMQAQNDGDFAGAIQFYSQVAPTAPTHFEAAWHLAEATYQQASALVAQQKAGEAAPFFTKAEELYRSAIQILAKGQEETLDSAIRARLSGYESNARVGLATLLIDVKKPAEVLPLLDKIEERIGNNPDMVTSVWSLRIRALQADGKLDDALRLFESLLQRTPDAPAIAPAAGVLARALDTEAQQLFDKDHASKKAGELWRKAASYYSLSVKSALSGTAALRTDDVMQVAQRLYVIGLFFNNVPEGQQTFVDWQGAVDSPDLWEQSALIYEKLNAQAPSYRVSIERARTLAILGRLSDAEKIYAALFDQVSLFDPANPAKFDRSAIEARPELVSAYLEYGVVTHLVALDGKDQAKLNRAADIYNRIVGNTTDTSRLWWQARYFQIKLLSDTGDYERADTGIRNIKRTTDPLYDKGKFGFKDKFLQLEAELSKKVFAKPATTTPAPKKDQDQDKDKPH